jgi:hypothetical protein
MSNNPPLLRVTDIGNGAAHLEHQADIADQARRLIALHRNIAEKQERLIEELLQLVGSIVAKP